jgi:predicted dehydrogenase
MLRSAVRGGAGVTAKQRCLVLGAGGMAEEWITQILPPLAGRVEIVGIADVSSAALARSGDFLRLDRSRRFARMEEAFDAVAADMCVIAVPAAFHQDAALLAAQHGVAILCEKPLADTWAACRAIYRAVRDSGVKMQVVQNYRYHAPVMAMRRLVQSGELGRINYVVSRFLRDYREYDSWERRHQLPHAMVMDGAAHHLDMLRNLTGSDCERIAAMEWNPAWSSSAGEFCALCILEMSNGTRATYEGNATAAGEQNDWHREHYRVECEGGSVTLGDDGVVRVHRHTEAGGVVTQTLDAPPLAREGHDWIAAEFVNWLQDGPRPATTLDDNIRTAATIFGAIRSAHTAQMVNVREMLEAL